jgi:hypothetical protein
MIPMSDYLNKIWNILSFPEKTLLEKRIPKKQFLESGRLTGNDKKLFRDNVKNVYWQYTLKPSTCPVLPYRDNDREYLEVAILHVELVAQKGLTRIAEIIHRTIPYPMMLVFTNNKESLSFSIAPKRFSQAEQGAFVAESFLTTTWLENISVSPASEFIASLNWNMLSLSNFGVLYKEWIDRFIAFESSLKSGTFRLGNSESRQITLESYRGLENQIVELKSQIKKAAFNKQVELNAEIKKIEARLIILNKSLK